MRNFNDFIRALGGIHNVLSGIAGKIDLIPASSGGGGLDYSTTEQDTGIKWIDGNAIYSIVLESTTTQGNDMVLFDVSDLSIDMMIDAHLVYYQNNTGFEGGAAAYSVNARANDTTLQLNRPTASTADKFYAVITYTKTSE